jgi:hypothetical protein
MKNKIIFSIIALGTGLALLSRAKANLPGIPQDILPIISACSLSQSVPVGQDGSATVTVLAGNTPKNIAFVILKVGVECSRSPTVVIPGDLAERQYNVSIPAATCLGAPGDYSTSIQMEQWTIGDLNHNGISADSGDLELMEKANRGEIVATPEFDLNWNGIPADDGDLELMRLASLGYIDLTRPKPVLLDEIISYINNNIITNISNDIQLGSNSSDGSNPYPMYCITNAIIRELIIDGGTIHYGICYWQNGQGEWINYNYPNPLGIKTYIVDIMPFAHSINAIPIDESGDLTDFNNWLFFQYNDRNIKPLSSQMPGNNYVTMNNVDQMQCHGILETTIAKWHIDEQGNVTKINI